MKILYAEDEDALQNAVSEILKMHGYNVHSVKTGREAIEQCQNVLYDIILMDLMMPDVDGIEAITEIRKKQVMTPIIILSAKGELDDKRLGFQSGADDYLAKPFNMDELLLKIEVLHRRNTQYQNKTIVYKNTTVDKTNGKMYSDISSVSISKTEADIFKCLSRLHKPATLTDISSKTGIDNKKISLYAGYLKTKLEMIQSDIIFRIKDDEYQFT